MISQPMRGLTDEEILEVRNQAVESLKNMGYEVVDSFFQGTPTFQDEPEGCNHSLFCLAKSLELLSTCDLLYSCAGWENNRGCRIERQAALQYGIEVAEAPEAISVVALNDNIGVDKQN